MTWLLGQGTGFLDSSLNLNVQNDAQVWRWHDGSPFQATQIQFYMDLYGWDGSNWFLCDATWDPIDHPYGLAEVTIGWSVQDPCGPAYYYGRAWVEVTESGTGTDLWATWDMPMVYLDGNYSGGGMPASSGRLAPQVGRADGPATPGAVTHAQPTHRPAYIPPQRGQHPVSHEGAQVVSIKKGQRLNEH